MRRIDGRMVQPGNSPNDLSQLTKREMDVLRWVTQGKTNAVIGVLLGISERTVKKHLERVFRKLHVENRTAAALHAAEPRPLTNNMGPKRNAPGKTGRSSLLGIPPVVSGNGRLSPDSRSRPK